MNAPPPPGLDPALVQPVSAGDARARVTLDAALAELRAAPDVQSGEEGDVAEGEVVSGARAVEALRLYTQGRLKRLRGEVQDAARDLQSASRLDPSSADIWRELGEAHLAMGNRVFASSAFARALRRDPDDIRVLEQTSRIALERREFDRAARLTARLLGQDIEGVDPALSFIGWWQLSRSLGPMGYVSASAEAAERASELPARFGSATSRMLELNAVYRQRGETLRDAGDARLRLGDHAGAERAYARAAEFPSLSPGSLTARRVYALMRTGGSVAAAEVILTQLRSGGGRGDESLLGLVGYVTNNCSVPGAPGSAAGVLRGGIEEIERGLPVETRSLAGSFLARARAAASSGGAALAILRERLKQAPADEDALRDVLARLRAAPRRELIGLVVSLVNDAPMQEKRYGTALARELSFRSASGAESFGGAEGTEADGAEAAAAQGAAGVLVRARLLAAENRPDEAAALFDTVRGDARCGAAATAACVPLLVQLGRGDEADKLIETLDESDDLVRWAKALALAQRGREDQALELLRPLLQPGYESAPGLDRSEVLLAAAELSRAEGRAEEALGLYERALVLDPLRDEAYVGIIQVRGRGGALEDEGELLRVIRRMRDANPSSRALRWMRAQESLARGQLDLAERDLIDLAEEAPTQAEVVSALTDLWIRTGSASQAEAWLKAKLERFPDSSALVIKLGDALAAQNRLSDTEGLLLSRLERTPGDAAVSRALEQHYRQRLNDHERADALARKRLASSPATAETMLELADMASRDKRFNEAGETLRALLERFPSVVFRADQAAKVGEFILSAAKAAGEEEVLNRAFVGLVNALADRTPTLSLDALRVRLSISARSEWVTAEELIRQVESAVKRFPSRAEQLLLETVQSVINAINDRFRAGGNARLPRAEMDAVNAVFKRALEVVEQSPRLLGKATVSACIAWIRLASSASEGESLERAVNAARGAGVLEAVCAEFGASRGGNRAVTNAVKADGAYALANALSGAGRDQAAEAMYRESLRLDPNHVGSLNDLGYRLLVADREIERAHEMIEKAVRAEPERAAYVDSLGWARYKLGVIFDDRDPETGEDRSGAVSLITRALALLQKDRAEMVELASPVIVDHLGDACWAAGDHETAARHWELAAESAEAVLKRSAVQGEEGSDRELGESVRKELEDVARVAAAKARSARDGGVPTIARMHGAINAPGGDGGR